MSKVQSGTLIFDAKKSVLALKSPSQVDAMIGARIRARREQIKLSQSQLGDTLGVSFQQIQKYESGKNRISAVNMAKVAKLLMVDSTYFFSGVLEGEQQSVSERNGLDDHETARLVALFNSLAPHDRRIVLDIVARAVELCARRS